MTGEDPEFLDLEEALELQLDVTVARAWRRLPGCKRGKRAVARQQAMPGQRAEVGIDLQAVEFCGQVSAAMPCIQHAAQRVRELVVARVVQPVGRVLA